MPSISRLRSKPWFAAAAALAALFVAVQFIRPQLAMPAVTGNIQAPEPVERILRTSCYNCHSNQTKLPWFDRIVPAYWLAAADVKRARESVNFSELDKVPAAQQRGILFDSVNQIQFGAMPLKRYELFHPESRISPEQLSVLKQYLLTSGERPPVVPQADPAAMPAVQAWPVTPDRVSPAPNGLAFVLGYRNWRALSSTDRFDNNTLRLVLGNAAAIDAVRNRHTNPWPDGTVFAKVAWNELDDGTGNIRPGNFVQVEFMIKDSKKYAATKGWGWGRWKGTDLQPYGRNADFAAECVGCHTPMRGRDFVFTTPVQRIDGLPVQPLQWEVINSSVDHREATMATLFGNDAAVRHARGGMEPAYPPGSVLSLVTWTQRADDHWFGARIPGEVRSVEVVTVGSAGTAAYLEYRGSPLKEIPTVPKTADTRVEQILGQRASMMP